MRLRSSAGIVHAWLRVRSLLMPVSPARREVGCVPDSRARWGGGALRGFASRGEKADRDRDSDRERPPALAPARFWAPRAAGNSMISFGQLRSSRSQVASKSMTRKYFGESPPAIPRAAIPRGAGGGEARESGAGSNAAGGVASGKARECG